MEYKSIYEKQRQSGIKEQVPTSQQKDNSCYFLNHCEAVRQDKETTKLRIVFDELAKQRACSSLNDCLDKDLNLMPNILNMLPSTQSQPCNRQ